MIKIIQMCDACGRDREIFLSRNGSKQSVDEACKEKGWREVRTNKHMCVECINALVK